MENFKREEKESRKDKFKWLKVAAIAVLFVGTGIGMFYGGNIAATKGFILTGVPEKAAGDLGKISDANKYSDLFELRSLLMAKYDGDIDDTVLLEGAMKGMASALGVKFYDENNKDFIPTGNTLTKISKIDNSNYMKQYNDIKLIGLCDVINPLYGKNGASYIYAPQKGANEQEVEELDYGLRHLEQVVLKDLKIDVANHPGSGAAGGMGYAILSFLNGKLQKGIQTILSIMEFNKELDSDTIIITGEGKLDSQSMQGKVIDGIIKIAKKRNVPVIVVTGTYEGELKDYNKMGIDQIIVTNPDNIPFEIVKQKCKEQLKEAIDKLKI